MRRGVGLAFALAAAALPALAAPPPDKPQPHKASPAATKPAAAKPAASGPTLEKPVRPKPVASAPVQAPTATARPAELRVPPGRYYVGRATGARDYKAFANAVTAGFLVMAAPVTQDLFNALTAWGTLHGYLFDLPCPDCDRSHDDQPVTRVTWTEAALFANALSEREGLDPVYRDAAGQPVRDVAGLDKAVVEPTLTGYRLPTIPEWHIALRGADKALADDSYGTPPHSPNALGLVGAAGPLAEWTASSMDLGAGRTSAFVCNEATDGAPGLSACGLHPVGWSGAVVAFRLVRKLPPEPSAPVRARLPVPDKPAPAAATTPQKDRPAPVRR